MLFPGQQAGFALTLATGVGVAGMQENVDALEAKAIHRQPFTRSERAFLYDLYETMATGASMMPPLRQSGKMMAHYLGRSGDDFELEPSIFTENKKVQKHMSRLRQRIRTQQPSLQTLSSPRFYMPDKSNVDSVFGLYYGTLHASPTYRSREIEIRWRAEVPWIWPSYPSLKKKYGRYHAESFPMPNIRSLLFGKEYVLYVDNGLGEYITHLNLAKSFFAYAEWTETIPRNQIGEHRNSTSQGT